MKKKCLFKKFKAVARSINVLNYTLTTLKKMSLVMMSTFIIMLSLQSTVHAQYCKPLDSYPDQGGFIGFGYGPLSDGTYHNGTDFAATEGDDVYAVRDGYVIYSKEAQGFGSLNPSSNGGAIVIRHQDNNGRYFYAIYGHLNRNLSDNTSGQPGQFVTRGQVIGTIRAFYNGSNYWPHLHFGIYYGTSFPTSGWGYSLGLTNWYDAVNALNNSSGPVVSTTRLTVYDFWKKADPIYATSSSDIWHPNFDAQYKIRNDGSESITIQRLALAVHYSDNRFCLDMSNPSMGEARYYDDLVLYPGQSQNFDFSVAYFRTSGNYKVVAKAQTADGVWNELASMDFVVQPETPPQCTTGSILMNQTVNGSWTSSCASTHKSGSYAQYYTFTLSSSQTVRIFLQSSQDTYLYLLNGNGTGGSVITSDDDGGGGTNSLIQRSLSAGTYTVEATTYSNGTTGNFSLSVTGGTSEICGNGIDDDGDGRTDCDDSDCNSDPICQTPSCSIGSISRGSSVSGSWTSSCASTHRTGSYAKYYTFSVASGTSIQIDLESSADTYLYVLSGNGMNGSVVSEDDDSGSSTNSRISGTANCSTCTFTIEATTYDRGTTGSFTLRLQ